MTPLKKPHRIVEAPQLVQHRRQVVQRLGRVLQGFHLPALLFRVFARIQDERRAIGAGSCCRDHLLERGHLVGMVQVQRVVHVQRLVVGVERAVVVVGP